MNVYHCFGHAVTAWPNRIALYAGQRPAATFVSLDARARRLAAGLARLGLARGDRVAIMMGNRCEYTEIMLACWAAGLCIVPVNAKLHPREFAFLIENSGAKACFTTSSLAADLAAGLAGNAPRCELVCCDLPDYERLFAPEPMAVAETDFTDCAWLFYTSGTTGRPKGATITHRNLWFMSLGYIADAGPIDTRTHALMVAPQSHAAGLLLVAYLTRGAACVVPESGGFDPAEMIPLINHFGGARFFAAPTMVKRFVECPEIGALEVPRLDTIVYGGGPMYVSDTLRALDTLGPRLWQIYGQGETPCTIAYLSRELHAASDHPRFLERLASVGMARTGIALRVVDEEFIPLPPGEVGEIIVRGETVMRGYWENPQASAQALHDGWLKTGDLGFLDSEGLLTLKDRSKDLIISGGSNIYPREVEEVLQSHPGVREVAVIGVPHAEWGEEPVAYVVMHAGHTPDASALEQVCLDNMARFKRPKRYVFVADLPKNNYGKILKTELRAWATQAGDTLA